MFKGSIVAIVTPFKKGKVDEKALGNLIEWHILQGTHGIVPCGTTGESATLAYKEHYRHYKKSAESVDIPLVLYNVPGRTAVNLLPSTVARLAEIKNIVAIKEASGDMKQVSEVIRLCGDRITVISGDDFTTLPLLALGGKGVISVSANVAPKDVSTMCSSWLKWQYDKARSIHYKLEPLNTVMFIETNPIPVKTALAMMGKIQEELRLPLCEMSSANKEKLRKVLVDLKLI